MKYYSFIKINILAMSALTGSIVANAQKSNATYSIGKDNVIQGKYFAKAKNDYQIRSNYESPANLYQPADISFKFAINGRDNEMISGQDHHFTVNAINGYAETPLIVFGQQLK